MSATLSGTYTIGVTLAGNPTTIAGTISAGSSIGLYGAATTDWTVVNQGVVFSAGSLGVKLTGAGSVENQQGAQISGFYEGIGIYGSASLSNAGTISASAKYGTAIFLRQSAVVTNAASGLITGYSGIDFGGSGISLLNQGVINARGEAVYLNTGTITNAAGGTILGASGIDIGDAATIINAGIIESSKTGGVAVSFGHSTGNALIVETGSTLVGAVANFASGDTIDLAGVNATSEVFAGGVLTLSNGANTLATVALAGDFNTGAFTLSSDGAGGTAVTLGVATFAGNYTTGLTLAALTDTITGSVSSGGFAVVSGPNYRDFSLYNQGSIVGSSTFGIGIELSTATIVNRAGGLIQAASGVELGAGTLINAGIIEATNASLGAAVLIAASTGDVNITVDPGSTLIGAIAGFRQGDTIDLANIVATSETIVNGVLTLSNGGAVVETLALAGITTGEVGLASDGAGGTAITIGARDTISGAYTTGVTLAAAYTTITTSGMINDANNVGYGHAIYGAPGRILTVVNSGTVTGTAVAGIEVQSGTIVNQSLGIINVFDAGVELFNGSFGNAGSITANATRAIAVELFGSSVGSLSGSNASTGSISSQYIGTELFNASLQNAGTITAADRYGFGVFLFNSRLNNVSGGEITGATGVDLYSGTVDNAGTILGAGTFNTYYSFKDVGIRIAGGVVTNEAGGVLEGPTGVTITAGVLLNQGQVIGNNTGINRGLYGGTVLVPGVGAVQTGGTVTNAAGGTISGAIGASLSGGMLIDAGTIMSTLAGSAAVAIAFGTTSATLVLDPGASLIGAIASFGSGDVLDFASVAITGETVLNNILTLENAGVVLDTVSLTGASFNTGEFTLASDGNGGTEITLGGDILLGSYTTGITLTVLDTTIAGSATVNATATALYGGYARHWTVLNQGTLENTLAGYHDGLLIKTSADVTNAAGGLISTDFYGAFLGGAYQAAASSLGNTLLNSGTIRSTGTYFNGTGVALGAVGQITNQSGGLIEGNIGIKLTHGGTILNQGTIESSASDGIGITLTSGGTIINQGTVEATGSAGVAAKFGVNGTPVSVLVIDRGSAMTGAVAGFVAGDTIDLAGQTITGETFAGGVLTLENAGVTLATVALAGNFSNPEFTLSADGAGGTNVTLGIETITGSYSSPLALGARITTFGSGGMIQANSGPEAVFGNAPITQTFDNFGTIENLSNYGTGAAISGVISNAVSGVIGGFEGVNLGGSGASLDNAGTIIGSLNFGAFIEFGTATNRAGALISGVAGIAIYNSTLNNAGIITATGTTSPGVDFFAFNGVFSNAATGVVSGGYGVTAGYFAVVSNAGTIESSLGTAGDAIHFGHDSSTLIVDPGAVFVGSIVAAATVSNLLELAAGTGVGSLAGIGETITGFATLDFNPSASWSIEGSAAGLASGQTINGFTLGDTIILDSFVADTASVSYVNGVGLELNSGASTITLDIAGSFATANFLVTDPPGSTTITMMPCFAAGTRILTPGGEIRVEDLRVGDRVIGHDATTAPITWIGHRTLDLRRHSDPETVQPVLIDPGAIADGVPARPLLVSPDHALFLEGHLIPAKTLINGASIRQIEQRSVTYYHIELARHGVLIAEGTPAESYLDTGNRGAFANGGGATVLHPDFGQTLRTRAGCAPFADEGPVVEAVRTGILRRAGIGVRVDPVVTVLRRPDGAAIIKSGSVIPGQTNPDPRDRRRLGVKVAELRIGDAIIPLDHPSLTEGWHSPEPDGRWTNGWAVVPAALLGDRVLRIA